MECESVSVRGGEYHHKVDIKRLLTDNHPGKAGRQAGKQSTESLTGHGKHRCLSVTEGSDAGLASDRDGDMISDRKL